MTSTAGAPVPQQVPDGGALNVDHVSHFVPDIDAASAALGRLGFALTPFSAQSHRLQPDGPLVPAGTGNRCVMLERGYLEFLTPTGDTPVADQLRRAIDRYTGVHLIAFGTSDPANDHRRLAAQGFEPLPPVALQRPIATASGEGIARFTVVRVPPQAMPEGRIQFCRQRTPELLWQPRWIAHANGALGLAEVVLCVGDVGEAAARFGRFTGIAAHEEDGGRVLRTARGTLRFVDAEWITNALGLRAPALPWIAGYAIETGDLAATRHYLERQGCTPRPYGGGLAVPLPAALGGVIVFRASEPRAA